MTNKEKKMFNIISHQVNVNQTTIHTLEWLELKRLTTSNADQDMEQLKLSHIASGNAKWYSYDGK